MADAHLPGEDKAQETANTDTSPDSGPQPVWTYRGYKLRASEFTTAMVHQFRAEVQRANIWRQRLDTTTNWAVITTGYSYFALLPPGNGSSRYHLFIRLLVTSFYPLNPA